MTFLSLSQVLTQTSLAKTQKALLENQTKLQDRYDALTTQNILIDENQRQIIDAFYHYFSPPSPQ